MKFFTDSLMKKLVFLFLVVVVIPISALTWLSSQSAQDALMQACEENLQTVNQIKKYQVWNYLETLKLNCELLAQSRDVKLSCQTLQQYRDSCGEMPDGSFDVKSGAYQELYLQIGPFFKEYLQVRNFRELYLISPKSGHVMYSVTRGSDLGTSLENGPYRGSGLARLWQKVLATGKFALVDFSYYSPVKHPAAFMGTPILGEDGVMKGVLVLLLDGTQINRILNVGKKSGESDENYLVGSDLFMRSNSHFNPQGLLKQKVDTPAVRRALAGQAGVETITDYRGVEVLSSFSRMDLHEKFGLDFEWAIISEVDSAEAFSSMNKLHTNILGLGILLLVVALVAVFFAARAIVLPLNLLMHKVGQMADGDLTITIPPTDRNDEIGDLVNVFNRMVGLLRKQTSQLIEGAATISATIAELSTTISELAASAAQELSSVSEIAATVEEIRQTSHLSYEKAEEVAEIAKQVMLRAENGRHETSRAVTGMDEIKVDMAAIASGIIHLSEQNQSIGEIVEMVNNLADQSNMLSVNASIEAAKAGEQGKGFAVVAQEVKALADQSKDATTQIRRLLGDIQKATSNAVMVTERGAKAVDKGVNQTEKTGAEIDAMAELSCESADASSQIVASSQQQLVGMDQVAQAMEGIKSASQQNVDGARQIEDSIARLEELGRKLQQLSAGLKV